MGAWLNLKLTDRDARPRSMLVRAARGCHHPPKGDPCIHSPCARRKGRRASAQACLAKTAWPMPRSQRPGVIAQNHDRSRLPLRRCCARRRGRQGGRPCKALAYSDGERVTEHIVWLPDAPCAILSAAVWPA